MKNTEFKVTKSKNQTVFTLESATGGGGGGGVTSSANVSSNSVAVGGIHRRADNLVTSEAGTETVTVPVTQKPRQGPLKPQTGAGAHRDKKKEQKQGQVKHKKPYIEDHSDAANRGWGAGSYDTYANTRHGRGVAEDMSRRGFLRGLGAAALGAAGMNAVAGPNDQEFINKVQRQHFDMVEKNPRYAKEHADLNISIVRGMSGASAENNKQWAQKTSQLLQKYGVKVNEGIGGLGYDAQSLITKLRRDVEEKRLKPTPEAVLAAARELAGDMEFAPQLLVQQVLGKGVAEGEKSNDEVDGGPALHGLKSEFDKFLNYSHDSDEDPEVAKKAKKHYAKYKTDNDMVDDPTGVAEDHEIQMASSELQSIAKNAVNLLSLVRKYSENDGLEAWQQSKITKAADYLNSVLQSISGEQSGMEEGQVKMPGNPGAYDADVRASQSGMGRGPDHRGLGQELAHETNNYAVAIDGRTWKVFADQRQAQNIAKSLQAKGKNATVHPTGENPSEGIEEDDSALQAFLAKGGKIQVGKTHPPRKAEKWQGSSHIGAAGGKGTKGSVSGLGANTKTGNKPVVSVEDVYMMELASKLAEKIPSNAPVDAWIQDFQQANPEKYHQFRQNNQPGTKKPEAKIAQMAVAASYAAKNPSKKK
jgi:hypothetical protein